VARRSLQLVQMFPSRSSLRSEGLDTKSQSKDVLILANKAYYSRLAFLTLSIAPASAVSVLLNNKNSRSITQKSLMVSSRVIDSCQLTNNTLSRQTENGNTSFSLLSHTRQLVSSFLVEKSTRYFLRQKHSWLVLESISSFVQIAQCQLS